jgi:hypothetical protein
MFLKGSNLLYQYICITKAKQTPQCPVYIAYIKSLRTKNKLVSAAIKLSFQRFFFLHTLKSYHLKIELLFDHTEGCSTLALTFALAVPIRSSRLACDVPKAYDACLVS